ncbi:hypothetical protein T492DRAFT_878864, partial [Pavlovales sp. CCMP2436]
VPAWDLPAGQAIPLPSNLLESLAAFEADSALGAQLGLDFCTAYLRLRRAQWREYCMHLTQWELDTYLDV